MPKFGMLRLGNWVPARWVRHDHQGGAVCIDNLKTHPDHKQHEEALGELAPARSAHEPEKFEYDGVATPSARSTSSASAERTTKPTNRSHLKSWPTATCAQRRAPRSTATPVSTSARPPSTRWSTTPRTRRTQQALHPPRELRALQDVRHRRPVPDHHLDAARRRRRARLHVDVVGKFAPR